MELLRRMSVDEKSRRGGAVDMARVPYASCKVLAEGAMGAVFSVEATDEGTGCFVMKFAKSASGALGKLAPGPSKKRVELRSADPAEVDMLFETYRQAVLHGLSPHVIRPLGVLGVRLPQHTSRDVVRALVMEKLAGVKTRSGKVVYNFHDLLMHSDDVARFDEEYFVPLLFQMLYTLAAVADGTGGRFRHNDAHTHNWGVTTRDKSRMGAVEYEILIRGAGASKELVACHFVLDTPAMAKLLDFGWASFAPPLGPVFDCRFFEEPHRARPPLPTVVSAKSSASSKALRAKGPRLFSFVAESGMSSSPCVFYDAAMLSFSVYQVIRNLQSTKRRVTPGMLEYLKLYRRHYGGVHNSVHMGQKNNVGRLTLEAQKTLQATECLAGVPTPSSVSDPFPSPISLLQDPFFARLRAAPPTSSLSSSSTSSSSPTVVTDVLLSVATTSLTKKPVAAYGLQRHMVPPVQALVTIPEVLHDKTPVSKSSKESGREQHPRAWGSRAVLRRKLDATVARARGVRVRPLSSQERQLWCGKPDAKATEPRPKRKRGKKRARDAEGEGRERCTPTVGSLFPQTVQGQTSTPLFGFSATVFP